MSELSNSEIIKEYEKEFQKPSVLYIFQEEILRKCKWAQISLSEAYETSKHSGPDETYRHYSSAISDAMAVYRLLNWDTTNNKNAELKAKARVNVIKTKWPNLPDIPYGLRKVRNKLEHFEESLDEWALDQDNGIFIDNNVGMDFEIEGLSNSSGQLRHIGSDFSFSIFDYQLKHKELEDWCMKIAKEIKTNMIVDPW